jgi:GTPase SAR1 family protein
MNKTKARPEKQAMTVIVLGSPEVGKTNILQRNIKRRFEETYIETIGK